MERYICERRCDEGLRSFKGGLCGTIRTINAGGDKRVIIEDKNNVSTDDYAIRRLTPRECWRLMDFSDSDFDETIAAYLPYPIEKVVPLGRTPVEPKKIIPSIADCIRLHKAYAQGDQKLYNELEDRFMKPSKIASRRQFMETVIAWAFIFFYLKIRRDHRYFTAHSFLLSSHALLS